MCRVVWVQFDTNVVVAQETRCLARCARAAERIQDAAGGGIFSVARTRRAVADDLGRGRDFAGTLLNAVAGPAREALAVTVAVDLRGFRDLFHHRRPLRPALRTAATRGQWHQAAADQFRGVGGEVPYDCGFFLIK